MGKTAGAHRGCVVLADAILVPGDEGDRDPRFITGEPRTDVAGKALTQRFEPAPAAGLNDRDRAERLADRADTLEPGIARKIVGAR